MSAKAVHPAGTCACGGKGAVILACSGAADVGEVADRTARLLAREGAGNMSCLAGAGARHPGMVSGFKEAGTLLVIDGCPTACGKKTVEGAGIRRFLHLQLGAIGLKKGATPPKEKTIKAVAGKARKLLGGASGGGGGCCGS